jgi:hypothetical protein
MITKNSLHADFGFKKAKGGVLLQHQKASNGNLNIFV